MFFYPKDLAEKLANESPVVVMSRGHSGTRVLGWALAKMGVKMGINDDKISADAEDLRFTGSIKKIVVNNLALPVNTQPAAKDLKLFQKRVWQYMKWLGDREPMWGWKFPETYLIPNYVHATFPKAKYIHMMRDGRDIAFKNHSTDRPVKLGKVLLQHINALEAAPHLRAARSWEFQVKRFEEFAESLEQSVHIVKFEELCSEPVRVMEGVSEFLGLPLNDNCREFLETGINQKKVAQFRSEDPAKIAEVENAVGDTLKKWNYF